MGTAPGEIVALAQQRADARAARDFATADGLRDRIADAGWLVLDTADGFELRPKPPYDVLDRLSDLPDNSAAPDKGQARTFGEEDLPTEIKVAAFKLEPGQVSPVVEYAGMYLIPQQVRTMEAKDADLTDIRRRAQLELFRKKGEQALERYIADLKKDTEIHVNRAVLPFDYTGEYRN